MSEECIAGIEEISSAGTFLATFPVTLILVLRTALVREIGATVTNAGHIGKIIGKRI
jgi:hypothetical protein